MVPVWEELNVTVTMDGKVQAVDKQYVFHPVRMEEDVCCLAFVFVVMGLMATVVNAEGKEAITPFPHLLVLFCFL